MAELKIIKLPNIGDFEEIEVIEVLIAAGDAIAAEDSIIVLESDKSTMEIPSPFGGIVKSISVQVGDRISEGSEVAKIEVSETVEGEKPMPSEVADTKSEANTEQATAPSVAIEEPTEIPEAGITESTDVPPGESTPGKPRKPPPGKPVNDPAKVAARLLHASPSIRRYARELGVNLEAVIGTGAKGRILKQDVMAHIKAAMSSPGTGAAGGLAVAAMPEIDFSRFGEIEVVPLSRIRKISGAHLHRSWVSVPHVTQFDEANITDLEAFRKSLAKEAEKKGVRLTLLVFMMKALVASMKEFPDFNASLEAGGDRLILKKYFHIGVAVDTPNGLVVPVIRDVDQKGLYDLAGELAATAARAREGKLSPTDMQGGCFTISSLGGIGGTQFTPIVNAPEVAILGIAKAKMQPVYAADGSFTPGLILPLALSYDHRVIDGAQGARFTSYLSQVITDIRRVLL
ncbi:MAG: branched-chain alpha-keto acid dehydrogenase subunit E2 [Gammaproteobacteria bacterium]|nr:MAG: branched-chain alpha-keto acid dehydrogenase subunit E2 [Gammaproteobacteria bacterium]